MYHYTLLWTLVSLLANCQGDQASPATPTAAEKVFFNGKIYTVDPNQPWAEAVYIKDGLIEYVGSKEADLIVLDRNIFEIPLDQIGRTKVARTYFRGQLIYKR